MRLTILIKAKIIDSLTSVPLFARYIGKKWYLKWNKSYTLAEKELSKLPSMLKNDPIIFDIGANRGELSYFFATTCKASKVYAFEPQKRMYNIICGVALKIHNIIPLHIALSDSSGEKTIHIPVKNTGRYTQAASFETNEALGANQTNEKVAVDTLDNFVLRNNINRIDFIKCDTEGHELSVFKGATKTLKTFKPLLYIEIKESNKTNLFSLLKSLGYGEIIQVNPDSENYYFS